MMTKGLGEVVWQSRLGAVILAFTESWTDRQWIGVESLFEPVFERRAVGVFRFAKLNVVRLKLGLGDVGQYR